MMTDICSPGNYLLLRWLLLVDWTSQPTPVVCSRKERGERCDSLRINNFDADGIEDRYAVGNLMVDVAVQAF
jgi:hypothetical protein